MAEMIDKVEGNLQVEQQSKGKFGVCFMCRSPAGYYCKDTLVPVCSADCKKTHL